MKKLFDFIWKSIYYALMSQEIEGPMDWPRYFWGMFFLVLIGGFIVLIYKTVLIIKSKLKEKKR